MGKLFPHVMAEYQNTSMFRSWTDPLMMVYFGYPFILGFVLYYLWKKVGKIPSWDFAKLYFIIATIPGMFITYTSFSLSLGIVFFWTVTGFVQAYLAGLVFEKISE
jgi:hypothetical protein